MAYTPATRRTARIRSAPIAHLAVAETNSDPSKLIRDTADTNDRYLGSFPDIHQRAPATAPLLEPSP
jgi:hypothetical protein